MIKQIFGILTLLALLGSTACNTTRVVKPLEPGELRIGGDLLGPFIANVPIPLSSLHAAYGLKERIGLFGGLQTTAILYGTLHLDLGANIGLLKSNKWQPGLSTNLILNPIFGLREGDFRLYPQIDLNAYWSINENHIPYVGLTNFLDIFYNQTELDKGSLYHPALNFGYHHLGRKWILGFEFKVLDFNKDIFIPQVEVNSIGERGGYGIYLKAAYKLK